MEVHHHPHVNSDSHRKKRFREYFLEFLMIFIAVTLGFFAESYRESIVNHEKEEDYMKSMVEDLQADTVTIAKTKGNLNRINKEIDTMLTTLKSDSPDPSLINRILSQNFWTYTGFAHND